MWTWLCGKHISNGLLSSLIGKTETQNMRRAQWWLDIYEGNVTVTATIGSRLQGAQGRSCQMTSKGQ